MADTRCPQCGRRKSVVVVGDLFRCDPHKNGCGAMFDDNPSEGGDYSDRNPAARMEREERRKK